MNKLLGDKVELRGVSKNPGFFYQFTRDSNVDPAEVSKNGGFFSCPEEAISQRDRGQRMLEGGPIRRKVTDQRRSVLRAGPAGSDNGVSVYQRMFFARSPRIV
jgi:hypothetical protein